MVPRERAKVIYPISLSTISASEVFTMNGKLTISAILSRHDTLKEIAELLDVCWLEIHARFEVSHLTPDMIYEVAFLVKVKNSAYGWWAPVNLQLMDAEGNVQMRREKLADKPREERLELKVGELRIEAGTKGEAQASFFEYEDGAWKSGLILEGLKISPKS